MVHGKNRIPYWIDRRLTGLAVPEYHAIISFGLPIEPEDSQYGEYRVEFSINGKRIRGPEFPQAALAVRVLTATLCQRMSIKLGAGMYLRF